MQDLVIDFTKEETPWQHKPYEAENMVWQGAAQRRRAHPRRTNVSLGTCAVDLSGPHEPTPRPGSTQPSKNTNEEKSALSSEKTNEEKPAATSEANDK